MILGKLHAIVTAPLIRSRDISIVNMTGPQMLERSMNRNAFEPDILTLDRSLLFGFE